MVPEYEEREASVFSHYNWMQWQELPWNERAEAVAHYRMHSLIESHMQQAIEQYMNRQAVK